MDSPLFPVRPVLFAPGTRLVLKDVYVFVCPLCRKEFRYDDPFEPMCTGPSESRDDHSPEVMRFARKETMRVMV